MKVLFSFSLIFLFMSSICGQNNDAEETQEIPYYEIPAYPSDYSPGNVAARVVDGLGYRYYWATEGLVDSNLAYKPSNDSRTILETTEHIYGLTKTTLSVVKGEAIIRSAEETTLDFSAMRRLTLENIANTSAILKGKSAKELDALMMVFKREDRTSKFPFWHLLNGPIADAIYHSGQIVAFRRAAGNPVDFRMNVFTGKNR